MPSSSRLGSRPRCCWMRANSAAVSPCCAMTSGERAMSVEKGGQNAPAVGIAEEGFGVAFGMRHHPQHVSPGVDDAGDVVAAPVGIVEVAKDHLAFPLQLLQPLVIDEVVPIPVSNGDSQLLPDPEPGGEAVPGALHPEGDVPADVLAVSVLEERAGKKPRLGENLKPVAD